MVYVASRHAVIHVASEHAVIHVASGHTVGLSTKDALHMQSDVYMSWH